MKIKITKNISDIGLKNDSNKNLNYTKNITSKNYYNLKDDINNYYCNEIGSQTPSYNYYYRMIPEIHYRSKFRNLRLPNNKNRFENLSIYSFQNNAKNIRSRNNKSKFDNHTIYSFQNNAKNMSSLNNKNRFENLSISSFQNNSKNISFN